ncbi:TnpV protein [Faecalicoccus sp.]|uniref:TnpV protein n=1 Tax=Bacillota TaxID=1239 RepID=UPI002A91A6A8|nr:TnpV protein [Faecalicoccus sp.]MDY5233784.1 TnpV protein [Faecalicoccus sp.]
MGQEFRYYQCGDYFIPDIQLSPYKHKVLGKYGRMRRVYLQEQNPMLLNDLILRDQLFLHLWEIDETAHCRVEKLMAELLKRNPMPNKATHQMAWVQHMNSLKAQAEEIVLAELIYS